ncbi:MAG: hypothetical protein AAF624_04820 [Bacteroidota bacterium]
MRPLLFVAAVLWLSACSEPDPREPDTPTLAQTSADIVGQAFVFFEDETGPRRWTVEAEEVQRATILDDNLDANGETLRRRLALTLASRNRTIEGEAFAYYERVALSTDSMGGNDGWRLTELARARGNFEARDRIVRLYAVTRDVRSPVDDRNVVVEPIAVVFEGRIGDPLAPFGADLDSLDEIGPRWLGDSTRLARMDGGVREALLNQRRGLWVIDPAQGSVPAPIRDATVDLVKCRTIRGEARASQPLSPEATLAATSSVYSGGVVGRLPTGEEQRLLLSFARERLRAVEASEEALRRLRPGRLLAADLDADGRDEFLGTFDATEMRPDAPQTWRLFVIARPDVSGKVLRPLAEVTRDDRGPARTPGQFTLLGILDLDGLGAAEVVLQQAGPLGTNRYRILGRTEVGWDTVFEGGVSGCVTESDAAVSSFRADLPGPKEEHERRYRHERDDEDVIGW